MLNSILGTPLTLSVFLICTAVSLALGIGCALLSMYKSSSSSSLALTLAILPIIVQVVILLVNGNIGAGVAVAGAFSLVRFRSAPGTARDIGLIFLAMALGLATGMGYVTLALLAFLVVALPWLLLSTLQFGQPRSTERILKITIPENLDYEGLFHDIFRTYLKTYSLDKVKTSNMGTLYELHYQISLKGTSIPKDFLDELRCRNGNLNIVCGREATGEFL